VPYNQIHFDPRDNVRPLNPARVRHIADLIKVNGYDSKEPLGGIVRKIDGLDRICGYIGQHRYHGAVLAISEGWRPKGWTEKDGPVRLPIIIDAAANVSRASMIVAGVVSNDGERLTPLELAGPIQELEREDLSHSAICEQLGITEQTIRDVLLLAAAPIEIHKLVRSGTVASTLAIEEIRAHGHDKALERLRRGVETAQKNGKSRVTRKSLPRPAEGKISAEQAKLLLQALQLVVADPGFGGLTKKMRELAVSTVLPFGSNLDLPDVSAAPPKANEYPIASGIGDRALTESGRISLDIKGETVATIRLAEVRPNEWFVSTSVELSKGGYASAPSRDRKDDEGIPLRQAVLLGMKEIQTYIDKSAHLKDKARAPIARWLDQLRLGIDEIDQFITIAPVTGRSVPHASNPT